MNKFFKIIKSYGATLFFVIMLICMTSISTFGNSNISHIRFGSKIDPLNGLTIAWTSQGTADSIQWGYTAEFEKGKFATQKSQSIIGIRFEYTFPTVIAGNTIYYKIFDSKDNVWTELHTFQIASDATDNQFTFTVFGDCRSYPEDWRTISNATYDTDFTLFMGDIINSGKVASDWKDWFDYGTDFISRETVFHCFGNHDRDSSPSRFENFLGLYTQPGNELYYSFNYGNAVFICLNTEKAKDKDQYEWLLSTLEANKNKTWKVIFFHKPFYTAPSHTGEMDKYFDTWWKAFDDYGVDILFNGHTHNYQRSKPINRNVSNSSPVLSYGSGKGMGRCEVVAGTAGAPVSPAADPDLWWLANSKGQLHFCNVEIIEDKLIMKAYDTNRVVFDSLVLDKSNSEITFQVDMRKITDKYDEGNVWVNFKSMNKTYKMSDADCDQIYTFTLPPIPIGTELEYSFSYQNGPAKTNIIEEKVSAECRNVDGNRFLKVPYGSFALPRVVFGSCNEVPQQISFHVDLSEVDDLYENGKVWIASDSWNKSHLMTDADDDLIYDLTLALAPGTDLKYYFAYQNGPNPQKDIVKESGSKSRCFNKDSKRTLWIGYKDIDNYLVVFNKCDEGLPSGSDITDLPKIRVKASNDGEPWNGGTGSPKHESIDKLTDNDIKTKYLVREVGTWIEIQTNQLSQISAYTIVSGNDAPERDPKEWLLQGWDSKTKSWITIHHVKNNSQWKERNKRRSWHFENDKWFSTYRLHVTDVNKTKSGMMQMSELHLFGELGDYVSDAK